MGFQQAVSGVVLVAIKQSHHSGIGAMTFMAVWLSTHFGFNHKT